jgi:hypothetical protein
VRISFYIVVFFGLLFLSCKKNKLNTDSSARIYISQDSVLFDTVFTTIGSAHRQLRVVNKNKERIKISSIVLKGGTASAFKLNVDGAPGAVFQDIEIAGKDSMYIFIQVNVNPTSQNSPLVISDELVFNVNGNEDKVYLEAWGQDAYYHRPTNALKFKDGTYFPYSTVSTSTGVTVTWANDKPHVIFGYLVVDEFQKLVINAGTKIYMNPKAGLWVFQGGEIKIQGQKGNEVVFQGVRREPEYADEPGQWDRIWINEGSVNNVIDYAIIKNGFIGLQCENLGTAQGIDPAAPRRLKLTNTHIRNMSLWGLYALNYNIYGGNNVISNCQEHSLNIQLGGRYTFIHCTFANYWTKSTRAKSTVNISNHTSGVVFPMDTCYFGNSVIDGNKEGELVIDVQNSTTFPPSFKFSSCWLKSSINTTDASKFVDVRKGPSLEYENAGEYNFEPKLTEMNHRNFGGVNASADAQKFPSDILAQPRNVSTGSVTAGAFK